MFGSIWATIGAVFVSLLGIIGVLFSGKKKAEEEARQAKIREATVKAVANHRKGIDAALEQQRRESNERMDEVRDGLKENKRDQFESPD